MLVNFLILVFIAWTTYWWGWVQGIYRAVVHLISTVLAGALALALWEPTVLNLLIKPFPNSGWGLGLLTLFLLGLVSLRIIAHLLIRTDLPINPTIYTLGGAAFGLLIGLLTSGLLIIALGYMPPIAGLIGYQPLVIRPHGHIAPNPNGHLWIPVDRQASAFYTSLSAGSFYGGTPLGRYLPDLATQAGQYTLQPESDGSGGLVAITSDTVQVTGSYSFGLPIRGLSQPLTHSLRPYTSAPNIKMVVVDTQWDVTGSALSADDTHLSLSPAQVQLVGHWRKRGKVKTQAHSPIGFTLIDPTSPQRRFTAFDTPYTLATVSDSQKKVAWVFVIPEDQWTEFMLIHRFRLPIPDSIVDRTGLLNALGQLNGQPQPPAPPVQDQAPAP